MFRLRALLLFIPLILSGCPGDSTEDACIQLDSPSSRVFIRDYQYDRFRIFDIGRIGDSNYLAPGDTLYAFWLFQSIGTLDPQQPEAVAYPNALDPQSSPDSVSQRFRQLDFGYDYELITAPHEGRNFIFFPEPLQNIATTTIAYHMVVRKADRSLQYFGDLTSAKFRLQILKRSTPQPSDSHWDSEWKNVYDLGARHIDWLELDLDVFKGEFGDEPNRLNLNHQNGVYYLRLLGLDSYNSAGMHVPDNKIDDDGRILDTTRGLVIFPNPHPFAESILEEPVDIIYNTISPFDAIDSSKYFIRFGYPFELGHRDIVEGSVRVKADGVRLPNDQFFVNNNLGQITFDRRADSALVNSSAVQVCFEYWK